MAVRILLIDDDPRLVELITSYLAGHGFEVTHAPDGARGLALLARAVFDAVLLDVMMPGDDGVAVLRKIRADSAIPVVRLTARGDEADRGVGLELGADDSMPKPCSPRALLARLRAVLRRASPDAQGERLVVAGLAIDVSARSVRRDEREIELTGIEFDILVALARRAGRVVPRESLLSEAGRGDVTVGERTVDVHISHLRQKLGDDPRAPRLLKTVHGIGYVMAKDA